MPVAEAIGRVTAEPIWALRSSPPFDCAAMDGIAVRAADTVGASESRPLLLEPGSFAVVDTGDPLPESFDAVVMREHVHYDDGRAELRAAVAPYQHVRSIGEDISATELLLPAGHRMRPVDAAAAAASGATEIRVQAPAGRGDPADRRRDASDRIGAAARRAARDQLADARRPSARGGMRGTCVLPIEPDDQERIAAALRERCKSATC